jgi:CRP-like cAMP-binding protein
METTTREKIHGFFSKYPHAQHNKGDIITFANVEHDHILYLTEGVVGQYDISPAGNKIFVNVFKPPAFFPMSWAINKTPNTYFFEALTDIRGHSADTAETLHFIKNNADVLYDLLSRVYRGADTLLRRLALAEGGSASNRVIFELIVNTHRFGEKRGDGYYLPLLRSDIAARSGLARETVSRELRILKDKGVITLMRGGIYIKDVAALEKMLAV